MADGTWKWVGPFTVAEAAAGNDTTVTLEDYIPTIAPFNDANEYDVEVLSGYGLVKDKSTTAFVLHNPAGAASTLDAIRFNIKIRGLLLD